MSDVTERERMLMRKAWIAGKNNAPTSYRPLDFDEWLDKEFPVGESKHDSFWRMDDEP